MSSTKLKHLSERRLCVFVPEANRFSLQPAWMINYANSYYACQFTVGLGQRRH